MTMSCFDVGIQMTLFVAVSSIFGLLAAYWLRKAKHPNLLTLGHIDYEPPVETVEFRRAA